MIGPYTKPSSIRYMSLVVVIQMRMKLVGNLGKKLEEEVEN